MAETFLYDVPFILTPCWTFLWVMRVDTFALFLTSEEKTSCLSPSDVRRFSSAILHQLEEVFLYSLFSFIMNEYWILSDTSVVSTAVRNFFRICPINMVDSTGWFSNNKLALHNWNKTLLSSYIFIYCSITFVSMFKVVFHFYSWETLVYIFILCLSRIL